MTPAPERRPLAGFSASRNGGPIKAKALSGGWRVKPTERRRSSLVRASNCAPSEFGLNEELDKLGRTGAQSANQAKGNARTLRIAWWLRVKMAMTSNGLLRSCDFQVSRCLGILSATMRLQRIISVVGVVLSAMLLEPALCSAQGTFNRTITFDEPPVIPAGTYREVTHYYENGMTFTPINSKGFVRAGGGVSYFPENRTAYLHQGYACSLSGSLSGVSRFGLYSVDLSEFITDHNYPATIQFVGYRLGGTVVTAEFTTDGIIDGTGPLADFQTFYFNQGFSDLVRFEVPGYGYAMDNLVYFDVIPEPGTDSLLLVGAGVLGCWFFKANRSSKP